MTKSVSFDFDETLDNKRIQAYAKSLILKGIDVHITTSRYSNPTSYLPIIGNHNDLYDVSQKLGIEKDKIHFTEFRDKADWFIENPEYEFIWHLDNDSLEVLGINNATSIVGINCYNAGWKDKCNAYLD